MACPDGVRAVLDGLAGIGTIEVDLRRDAFSICYDGERVSVDRIRRAIEQVGFRPRRAPAAGEARPEPPPRAGAVPEPIAGGLSRARAAGALLLVEFHAEWCAPCAVVHNDVLPDPAVRRAMERFVLLRVDVDRHPEAGRHFRVDAMPTLLVLGDGGQELDRFVGVPEATALAARLANLAGGSRRE